MWRTMFRKIRLTARQPKVGVMKHTPRPGLYRYAVAVPDGSDLWITTWIKRAPTRDVYLLIPRGDRGLNAHASYHRDGRFHQKNSGRIIGDVQHRQPLTDAFKGAEHLGAYMGHGPKRIGAICDPRAYTGVVEVPPGILGPRDGAVVIDLVEPGCQPAVSIPFRDVVIQKEFREASPWLVVRVTR